MNAHEGMREHAGKLANCFFAQAGKAVANVLELRYAENLATLLIADCDQARLHQYLGLAASRKLLGRSWRIVQLGKPKEITKCRTQ